MEIYGDTKGAAHWRIQPRRNPSEGMGGSVWAQGEGQRALLYATVRTPRHPARCSEGTTAQSCIERRGTDGGCCDERTDRAIHRGIGRSAREEHGDFPRST